MALASPILPSQLDKTVGVRGQVTALASPILLPQLDTAVVVRGQATASALEKRG